MCGRFNLRTSLADVTQLFLIEGHAPGSIPHRYNIAPTQEILTVRRRDGGAAREGCMLRWGLVPGWARDLGIGSRMINARSETVEEKNSFKAAFKRRRCLIPVTGYYEWQRSVAGDKQPFVIELPDRSLFAFAGLWEQNRKAAAQPVETCTILTRAASAPLREIHDRMPVIVKADDWERWLDPDYGDTQSLHQIMEAPPPPLSFHPVNRYVNNARNEGPQCVAPPA